MDCAAPASFTHTRHTRYAVPPFPPSEGIGGGPKERGSLASSHRLPPPPANENWRKGSNCSRDMHILTIWRRHLAEGGVAGPNGELLARGMASSSGNGLA